MKQWSIALAALLAACSAALAQSPPPAIGGQAPMTSYCWNGARLDVCGAPGTGGVGNGSVGADASANAPAGPGAGTTLTYNGLTLTLLTTKAANPARRSIEVNNTSGSLAVVVMDDGANTAGTVSLLPLEPNGLGQFHQGADWPSTTELGRVRIFGAAGSYVFVREN